MISGISSSLDSKNFDRIVRNAQELKEHISFIEGMGIDQRTKLQEFFSRADMNTPADLAKFQRAQALMRKNTPEDYWNGVKILNEMIPEQASAIKTSKGIAIMAEGWDKPIVFPKDKGFKWLGWADNPQAIETDTIWTEAYGEKPPVILGAVGNSNIKPEQVTNGCSLTKKELSKMYEQAIENFYKPIIGYFKELGVKADDIGFAFAHSDCGVDLAARNIVENNGLKGIATTPTTYTKYIRGIEKGPDEEFPNGYIEAQFPFPTVLTRGLSEINDYAQTYSKLVGKKNPVLIVGGGEHAFYKDAKSAIFEKDGSLAVPYDIVKEELGYEIPSLNDKGVVTNAARYYMERVNGNPYAKYKPIFNSMPYSPLKEELKQNDAQMAVSAIIYSQLKGAGKIK